MKPFNVPPNSRPVVSQQPRSTSFHLRYAFHNLTAPRAIASVPPDGDSAEAKTFNPISWTLSTNRGMSTLTSITLAVIEFAIDDVSGEASQSVGSEYYRV